MTTHGPPDHPDRHAIALWTHPPDDPESLRQTIAAVYRFGFTIETVMKFRRNDPLVLEVADEMRALGRLVGAR